MFELTNYGVYRNDKHGIEVFADSRKNIFIDFEGYDFVSKTLTPDEIIEFAELLIKLAKEAKGDK